MGRWGYRVFEGDTDLDILSGFEADIDVSLCDGSEKLEEARVKLDAGLGAKLMTESRQSQIPKGCFNPKYETLILGAVMMHVGAKISADDRAYLNNIFPQIESRNGYAWPLNDEGFRDPGQVQYKAALENYVDGQPRSFFDPSCYNCGKIAQDIAPVQLKRCVGCEKDGMTVPYCDKDCQKANWKKHKVICGSKKYPRARGGMQFMNV